MIKKIISRGISAVLALLTILSLMLAVSIMIGKSKGIPQIFGYSFMRVVTGSMEPVIKTGSVIFVKNCGEDDIQEQDIITFYSADPEIEGMIVTHRVVGISSVNGERLFTTRGDANNKDDDHLVGGEALIGKVKLISFRFGKVFELLTRPGVYIILVIIPLGLMLILNMVRVAEVVRDDDDEEEAEEGMDEVPETEEKLLPGPEVKEEKEEPEETKNRKAKKEDKKTADKKNGSGEKRKDSSGNNQGKDVKKKKSAGEQNIYRFKSYYTKKKKKRKGKNGKIKKKR